MKVKVRGEAKLLDELRAMLTAGDAQERKAVVEVLAEITQMVAVELEQRIADKWQRTLPLGDSIVDRWERARRCGFGAGTSAYDSSVILGDVRVGDNTWIGPFTVLDGSGGLSIGSNCSISAGVQIYSHDSVRWAVTGGREPIGRQGTVIGDCCYIGPNTIIAKGVEIGSHSIIGANSLVLEDIPPHSKAVGSPCRVVGKVSV